VNNLEEQFFEECSFDKQLRAAVLDRTSDFVDVRYLGRGHLLYVRPLAGTPWTLVVFGDKQTLRTVNLEMLTLSLMMYGGILAVLSLFWAIILLARRSDRQNLFWPEKRRASFYLALVWVNVVLGSLFALLAIWADGTALFIASLAIPAISIACFTVPKLLEVTRLTALAQ